MDQDTADRIGNKLDERSLLNDEQHEDKVRRARLCYDSLEEMPPDDRDACIARDAWEQVTNPIPFTKGIDFGLSLKANTHALYTSALQRLTGGGMDLSAIRDHAKIVSEALVKQRIEEMGGDAFLAETDEQILCMIERLSDMDGSSDAWFIAGYIEWLASNTLHNSELIGKHIELPQFSDDDEVEQIDMWDIDPERAREFEERFPYGSTIIEVRTTKPKDKK